MSHPFPIALYACESDTAENENHSGMFCARAHSRTVSLRQSVFVSSGAYTSVLRHFSMSAGQAFPYRAVMQ